MLKFQSNNFFKSALFALNGLRLAFKSQRNFRKHIVISLFTLVFALIFNVGLIPFCLILFADIFALSMELINSCIEFIMDAYYKNKWAKLAKLAKDMAAASVLLASCLSVGLTLIFCLNKILLLYF